MLGFFLGLPGAIRVTSQDYSDVLVDGSSDLLHLHIVLVVLPAVLLALQMVSIGGDAIILIMAAFD